MAEQRPARVWVMRSLYIGLSFSHHLSASFALSDQPLAMVRHLTF